METQENPTFVRKDYVVKGYAYFRPPVPMEFAERLGWKDGEKYEWQLDEERQGLFLKKVN